MNEHCDELIGRLEARFMTEDAGTSMSEWISQNTTIRGRPFGYAGYEFQRQIADDMHPDLTCIKCSQVGMTEVQIRKILGFLKRTVGVAAMLTFPNQDMYKKNSQTRVKPLVDADKVFNMQDDEKAVRSRAIIQIGKSFLYVTGCTEAEATSTPADALFHDELDISPQDMIGLYQSRLQNSNYRITQRFSTPTFTGFGVDRSYMVSDQREYFCKCSACGHQNVPSFTRKHVHIDGLPPEVEDLAEIDYALAEQLDLINAYVKCERCDAQLDLADPTLREWVATYPSRTLSRGYRIRPFSTSKLSIGYIVHQLLRAKEVDYVRGWYNTVLGEPYTDGNARLEEADILACMDGSAVPDISRDQPVYLGLDIGQVCHLVLGTQRGAFHFEVVPVAQIHERVAQVLKVYRVVGGCVDRHPYTPTADALREQSESVILPIEYRGTAPIGFVKNEYDQLTHMQANRTQVIDEVMKNIRHGRLRLAGYGDQQRVVIEQLRDLVRDEKPDEPAKFIKLSGNDHYAHALAFMLLSMRVQNALWELNNPDPRMMFGMMGASMALPGNMLPMISQRSNNQRGGFSTWDRH